MQKLTIKRALISVYDKTDIVDFAKFLSENGVEILSTGGTYNLLLENNIKAISIEEWTGQNEILGGRVKTLHPKIHGAILNKRDDESAALKLDNIDLVVVNLYPFEKLVAENNKNLSELIEMIDIGGPTMLRACAKNYLFACPVISVSDYEDIIDNIKNGGIPQDLRFRLAVKVFKEIAYYDSLITDTLSTFLTKDLNFNNKMTVTLKREINTRYGENPHQKASYYSIPTFKEDSLSSFFTDGKIWGKELSYNNIADIDTLILMLSDLENDSAVALKHQTPCCVASKNSPLESFTRAYEMDKVSIYGGIVGIKGVVNGELANILSNIFLEIVVAEYFEKEAIEILTKKQNLRLMEYKNFKYKIFDDTNIKLKSVIGGVLVQEKDLSSPYDENIEVVTNIFPTDDEIFDLRFGQTIVKNTKSNAIAVVKDRVLIGVGAGQPNRVGAALIALDSNPELTKGAVLASDAFLPMDDTVQLAAKYGIKSIIQPGGSIKDEDTIKACNRLGISMVFTKTRHFYH